MSERDKFLTEAMGGDMGWWPSYTDNDGERWNVCRKYPTEDEAINSISRGDDISAKQHITDFSTWAGFGKLVSGLNKTINKEPEWVEGVVMDSLPFDDNFPNRFADNVYALLTADPMNS